MDPRVFREVSSSLVLDILCMNKTFHLGKVSVGQEKNPLLCKNTFKKIWVVMFGTAPFSVQKYFVTNRTTDLKFIAPVNNRHWRQMNTYH